MNLIFERKYIYNYEYGTTTENQIVNQQSLKFRLEISPFNIKAYIVESYSYNWN